MYELEVNFFSMHGFIQIIVYKLPITDLSKFPVLGHSRLWWIAYSLVGIFIPVLTCYLNETIKNKIKSVQKRYLLDI